MISYRHILTLLSFNIGIALADQLCGIKSITCENSDVYRSIDGSCNNKKHPSWGTPNTTYTRLLPPSYEDGEHSFPLTAKKKPLPSARNLTVHLHNDDLPDTCERYTLLAMTYGQLVAHDLSSFVLTRSPAECCTEKLTHLPESPEGCASIDISSNDPIYSHLNATCLPFFRSKTSKDLSCQNDLVNSEKISEVNCYLDLSVIYGQTKQHSNSLRAFKNGYLMVEERNGHQWPLSAPRTSCSGLLRQETTCYRSGDGRFTQNPQLTIIHHVWTKEHNRIAQQLSIINPHWNDEKLFQVARSITIAEYQHITFSELLPIHLGYLNLVKNEVIFPFHSHRFVDDYDENAMPQVYNEFATSAFRQFHSTIAGKIGLYNGNGCPYDHLVLRDHLNRPVALERGDHYDSIIRGLGLQGQLPSDIYYDSEVTSGMSLNKLRFGEDLKSTDIQRSRDHGLPFYNDMREYCGLKRAKTFKDFTDVISMERVKRMQAVYDDPDDVELIIGGAMETRVKDSLVGPTFHCILLKQFKNIRKSDRFWYENSRPYGFTAFQLKEIRRSKISRILCDNGNNIAQFQTSGFMKVSVLNPLHPCESLPTPNLLFWKDVN